MRGLLGRLCLAIATGYIFAYFSEYAFWARPLENTRLPDAIWLLLLYSFAAYVFLILVATLRVRSFAAIFLAGALYGWLVEGVFVQTMYGQLPLSISFTGLAWHALITVLVGWFAIQRLLRSGRWWRTLFVASVVGAVYGLWAIWWWVDAPPAIPSFEFAQYAFATTAVLACAYWLASRPTLRHFSPTRAETIILPVLIVIYFAVVTLPSQPLALIVLPPLVFLVLLTLLRNRRNEPQTNILAALETSSVSHPVRLRDVAPVFAVPLVASAVYALAQANSLLLPTGWAFYAVTTLAGFVLLIFSIVTIWRTKVVAHMETLTAT